MPAQPDPRKSNTPSNPPVSGYISQSFSLQDKDVHFVLPSDLPKHHGDPSNPDIKSFSAVRANLEENLEWLFKQAVMGQREALRTLQELGVGIASVLGVLAAHGHAPTLGFAETVDEWPMVISPAENHPQNLEGLRQKLKLGEGIKLASTTILSRRNGFQCEIVFLIHRQFEGLRTGTRAVSENQRLQTTRKVVSEIEAFHRDRVSEVGIIARFLDGKIESNRQTFHKAMGDCNVSKSRLIELLKLETQTVDGDSFASLVEHASALPEYAQTNEDDWLNLTVKYLDFFVGGKIQDHPDLRPLGQPDGDYAIRTKEKKPITVTDEYREKYRHDDVVNNEIRGQIIKKLRVAMHAVRS